jgi:hypothetical protein
VSPQTISLRQAFQKLSGSARLHDKRLALRDPGIDGDRLFFTVSGNVEGESVLMSFSGRVADGRAAGNVVVNGGPFKGTHPWNAQRSAK